MSKPREFGQLSGLVLSMQAGPLSVWLGFFGRGQSSRSALAGWLGFACN